jgi:hypothetical protein
LTWSGDKVKKLSLETKSFILANPGSRGFKRDAFGRGANKNESASVSEER